MAGKNVGKKRECSSCKSAAVFYRDYEGRLLCEKHFIRSIEKKVKKTVGKFRMVEPGDSIGVALSGGKDSATALYLMKQIIGKRRDITLAAISVDEGIKGSRDVALKKAAELCRQLGVKQHVFSYREEFGNSLDGKVRQLNIKRDGICGLCGVSRRWILNKKARELGFTKLCLGMNLDDEAESIMMNYVRGDIPRATRLGPVTSYSAGMKGGGSFVPRIKPLRWIPENEVELYAKLKGLPFMPKGCKYRGGLRVDVEKALQMIGKKHIGLNFTVVSTFDRMVPGIRSAAVYSGKKILSCKKCGEPSSQPLCKACELWEK